MNARNLKRERNPKHFSKLKSPMQKLVLDDRIKCCEQAVETIEKLSIKSGSGVQLFTMVESMLKHNGIAIKSGRIDGRAVKKLFLGEKSNSSNSSHGLYREILEQMQKHMNVEDLWDIGDVMADMCRELSRSKSLNLKAQEKLLEVNKTYNEVISKRLVNETVFVQSLKNEYLMSGHMLQTARLCSLLGKADEESGEHKHADANAMKHMIAPLSPMKAVEIIVDNFLVMETADFMD